MSSGKIGSSKPMVSIISTPSGTEGFYRKFIEEHARRELEKQIITPGAREWVTWEEFHKTSDEASPFTKEEWERLYMTRPFESEHADALRYATGGAVPGSGTTAATGTGKIFTADEIVEGMRRVSESLGSASGALTGAADAFRKSVLTMDGLRDALKGTFPLKGDEMAASSSASPSWVSTTLRWLREKYPHYLPSAATGVKAGVDQLSVALRMMSYRRAESERASETREAYEKRMDKLAKGWSENDFRDLKAWLAAGGYTGEKEKLTLEGVDPSLAVTDLEELEVVEQELRPRSEHTPEQELDEAVAVEQAALDPRHGSW